FWLKLLFFLKLACSLLAVCQILFVIFGEKAAGISVAQLAANVTNDYDKAQAALPCRRGGRFHLVERVRRSDEVDEAHGGLTRRQRKAIGVIVGVPSAIDPVAKVILLAHG